MRHDGPRVLVLDQRKSGDAARPVLDALLSRARVTLLSGGANRPEYLAEPGGQWFDRRDNSVGTLIRRLHRAEPFDSVVVFGIDDEWHSAEQLDGVTMVAMLDETNMGDPGFDAHCEQVRRADATVLTDATSTAAAALQAAPGLDARLSVAPDSSAAARAILQRAQHVRTVLVLSPSADLYGSDQALLDALPALVSLASIT
ncbi:MAG: hypothetical protein IH940_06185, partial [Acidobacteria bacterium]|nr:hypothetical protein [Acidobacteriota bacterium]